MKKLLTAVALSIALPSIAHAQAAPSPAKEDCCDKMKAESKKSCCDDMDKAGHEKPAMKH